MRFPQQDHQTQRETPCPAEGEAAVGVAEEIATARSKFMLCRDEGACHEPGDAQTIIDTYIYILKRAPPIPPTPPFMTMNPRTKMIMWMMRMMMVVMRIMKTIMIMLLLMMMMFIAMTIMMLTLSVMVLLR